MRTFSISTCLFLLSFPLWVNGQQAFNKAVVPLIQQQIFRLDGKGAGVFTKNHTNVLVIDLPESTISWHYRFVVLDNEKQANEMADRIQLCGDMDQYVIDSLHPLKIAPSVAKTLKGNASIYLLKDSLAAAEFQQLLSFNFSYENKFSRQNQSNGYVKVDAQPYLAGPQYLAMSNSSTLEGCYVYLEAVALVKKPRPALNGWTYPELEDWHNNMVNAYAAISDTQFLSTHYSLAAECFVQTLQNQVNASFYKSASEIEQQQWYSWIFSKCLKEAKKNKIAFPTQADKYLMAGKWESEKGEILHFSYSGTLVLTKNNQKELTGNWDIDEDGALTLTFKGFKPQKYQSESISHAAISWKNLQSGKYLRLKKAIMP